MELDNFIKKFAACFHQTDPVLIKGDTAFKQLEEWGSMLALIVIAMVDSDYGKTLHAEDLKNAGTVSQLFDIVKSR
jgi:acyl carrier protein